MNSRQIEKLRKEVIVYSEIVFGDGKTAREISDDTGLNYLTTREIIERLKADGKIESVHTTSRYGAKHRVLRG